MTKRSVLDLLTVLAITFALLLPLSVYVVLQDRANHDARNAFITSCNDANKVRAQLLTFIDGTVSRSEAATNALIASPNSSDKQRRVARKNLDNLQAIRNDVHGRLPAEDCSYPPHHK